MKGVNTFDRVIGGKQIFSAIQSMQENYCQYFYELAKSSKEALYFKKPLDTVLIFKPSTIKYILKDNQKNYIKSRTYKNLYPILGRGLLTQEGAKWRKNRRLMAPFFTQSRLMKSSQLMEDKTDIFVSELKSKVGMGESLSLDGELMKLVLELAQVVLFGLNDLDISERIGHSLEVILDDIVRRAYAFYSFPLWVPTARNFALKREIRELDRISYGIIKGAERRLERGEGSSFVFDAILASFVGEEQNSKGHIYALLKDELLTLLLAGHETTGNALCWTLYLLARNKDKQDKLHAFLIEQGDDFDMKTHNYMDAVLWEAMRLYPPIPGVSRNNLEEDVLEGVRIKPQTRVEISLFATQRNEVYFEDALSFKPERFVDRSTLKKCLQEMTLAPFAAGPRVCIGQEMALIELKVIVRKLLKNFEFIFEEKEELSFFPTLTLRPTPGLRLYCKPRL